LKSKRQFNVIKNKSICLCAGSLGIAGCARAPSINILGAFFPAWMACIVAGIVLTFALRAMLIAAKMDGYSGPRGIIYPASTILFTLATWLIFFRN
jgi:hypothetical protein